MLRLKRTRKNRPCLSLKEAREQGRLDEFAQQHEIPPEDQHPMARERFKRLFDLAFRTPPEGQKKSREHKGR